MTDKEAYEIIGKRTEELAKKTEIQSKMLKIAKTDGKEAAERWLYMFAIATLCGI